ncbi:MAG: hypothetical protein A2X86_18335 [Bdellovibrionales bacterium GWA2_49_15]|nr:MAG: hypothetical protein A2X86_18335 [Bdellovibrionales bacterium GWA2_49_15]HAZ11683.1 hypothetical protein [Bdellovibrionales bacterium]
MEQAFYHLTYAALLVLSAGIFTSVSFSALAHILLVVPAVHYTYKNFPSHKLSKTSWALLGVILTIALSVVANLDILPHPLSNLLKVKYFFISLLGIFALAAVPRNYFSNKRLRVALNLFLLATTVASISGIVAYYTGFNYLKWKPGCHPDRACGLYGMYMTYGYGLSLFMVLLTGLLIYRDEVKQWIPKWWLGLAFAINGFGLYLAFARGGWIGYAIAIPCFFLKKNKKIIFALIAVAALFFVMSYNFLAPFKKMVSDREGSNAQRISFAQTAIVAFKERPVFGWGYRNFEPNVKALKEKYDLDHKYFGGHAHNNYLEHLASTGILGFLAILIFSFFWAYENFKRDDLISRLTFPFVISFIVSGQFQYTFGDGENLFLIMTVFLISEAASIRVLTQKPLPKS